MADESLHDAALMGHVCDHCDHVVITGANQRWTKHDGQVAHVHLVHVRVGNNVVQMHHEEPKCFVMVVW